MYFVANRENAMIRNRTASFGFTLIELLMTMAIVAILLSISLPSMATLFGSTQARAASQDLASALNTARATALQRGSNSVACPSVDQLACSGGTRWDQGWIVFGDRDGNSERSADEALIAATGALNKGVAIASTSGRDRVTFRADGSSIGSNVTITLCDRRGASAAASIVINNPGRIRRGTPTAAAAVETCALLGPNA